MLLFIYAYWHDNLKSNGEIMHLKYLLKWQNILKPEKRVTMFLQKGNNIQVLPIVRSSIF